MKAGARWVVTGASGWVGRAVLHGLAARLGSGWPEQVTLFGSTGRTLAGPGGAPVTQLPLADLSPREVADARVLHLAFLGREQGDRLEAGAFRQANSAIDARVEAAIREAGGAAALFVASSGAAREAAAGRDAHPYALAKLEQEARFAILADVAPVCVGRIWTLAGPYMNKPGGYALSSLLLQARMEGRVRIAADRPTFRSYLHALDLAALVLAALEVGKGWDGPLDLCGMEVVEMADVALAAARAVGLGREAVERGATDLSRPSAYLGDPVQTRTLALRHGLVLRPFEAQVRDTARWLFDAQVKSPDA